MQVSNRPLSRHAIAVSAPRCIEEIERIGLRFGWARVWFLEAVLMVLAGVVSTGSVAAQSISFAAPFTSFTQNVVVADQGIVADANSNLYITGTSNTAYLPLVNNMIDTQFDTNTLKIDGAGTSAYGLAIDSGSNLYRVDDGAKIVNLYIFKGTNDFNNGPFVSGSSTGIPIGPTWTLPSSVAVDGNFNVYVLDAGPGSIIKLVPSCIPSPSCTTVVYTASTVYTDTKLIDTTGMSLDSTGNFYFASGQTTSSFGTNISNATAAVYKLPNVGSAASPSYSANSLVTLGSGWSSPSATAVDTLGNVWVADFGTSSVYELAPPNYTKGAAFGVPLTGLSRLTVSKAGQLFGLGDSGDAVVYVGGTAPHNLGAQDTSTTSTTTVNFVTPATAVSYVVLSEGTNSGDFTDTGTGTCSPTQSNYAAGANCDVIVSFTPKALGLRLGAVAFLDSSGAIISTNYLFGVGSMPEVAILPGKMGTYAGAGAACAGTGSACGDGSAASSAQLNHPSATLVDEASNLYIADFNSNLVRKVTTQGVISTVAGDGTACSSASATCGDGGAATAANLTPSGIALDGAGNLYIADEGRIRMVNLATGMISTVAGTGAACSSPTAACGDGGSAASAQLNLGAASGLAVDGAGNLLIADSGDNRIRSVALATGVISTVSGTGATCSSSSAACGDGAQAAVAQFNNPTGIAVDASENYLIADTGDNRVRKISALTSSISTVAGNGTQCTSFADCGDGVAATSAQLNAPTGVAADAAGNIYIADTGDNVIRMASVVTNHISTVAGNAVACATDTAACGDGAAAPGASLNLPSGVALDNAGNLYIADANDNRVRQVNVSSPITLNFPNTEVSTTSSAQSVTVENIGNASLSFTAAGVAAPTDYIRGTGSTCADSGTVATGASCTLSIQFSPTTNGLLNEFFMLTDNSLNVTNASQSIAVSGTAGALPTATQEVASTTLTQNHAAMSFTPVTGSGGTGALTYTVSPSLPSGLSMNPATGAIMGTPTGTSSSASYTVTVTDTNGATGTATFSLTVNGAIVASQAVASTSLTESRAAIPFTTVTATGGTGTLTYSVSPALPTGLTFNSATGAITGTPTGTSSLTSYTVTVTDSNGATAAASFNLTVDAAVVASQGVVAASLTENHAAMSFTPVTGAGGTGTLTYSVSPALPAGLSLNAATGAITGTPTGTSSLTIYTVTVTDSNSATAMATFSLTVNASISTTVVVGSEMLTVNSAASFTPITATGGTGALAYSVSPGLPAGLSLNAVTGAITGTPTGTSALASYTVTVTDANGSTATASFSLQVQWMQPVVAITAPGASMTYGTALGIGATATYNSSAVAGSFSYTAMPAGGVAHIVTAATVLPAGSYTLTARFAPANAMLYATATQTALLTVSQATTAVSVSTSMNPSVLQNPITITAMVNAQATGSVSFMSGTTPLGSGAVSGGVATLITSSLPAGSQSIVAVYGGDSNFVAATSAASSQMVLDFGVNTGSASGAGSSGSGMAQTVAPGKAATYMLAITPTAGTQLPLATVLSVSGLPSGATASLSNAAWTQLSSTSWSLPSNTPIGNVALTFQIPSETASAAKKDAPMHPLSPVLLGVLFLPFAAAMRRRGRCLGRSLSLLLLLVAGTVGMTGLTGCGTSGGFFGQAQATYNVTVTVTTGTLSHSTNLTLTVE